MGSGWERTAATANAWQQAVPVVHTVEQVVPETEYIEAGFGIGQWVNLPIRFSQYGEGIEGVVTAILITAGECRYLCAWCIDGAEHKGWFEEWRLTKAEE